jgi:hypothetical protein
MTVDSRPPEGVAGKRVVSKMAGGRWAVNGKWEVLIGSGYTISSGEAGAG